MLLLNYNSFRCYKNSRKKVYNSKYVSSLDVNVQNTFTDI